jgi:hypothetical protein
MMILKPTNKNALVDLISKLHYSPIMPRLTKHYLGCYVDGELVGGLTFGWGTRPKHTIQKMFPELDTQDYFEIGKMALIEDMPRNSESQMLKMAIRWLRENTNIKYLFTWADGIVGKPGYVYQASNFLYGGYNLTDTYVTKEGEKVHPRTMQGRMPKKEGLKMNPRPTPEQLKEMHISRVKGKQFKYIYPMNKKWRRYLKESTTEWTLNYPKHTDLEWQIKGPGEDKYVKTSKIPFDLSREMVYNKQHNKNKNNLEEFFV